MDNILKAIAGGGQSQSTYQVIALERINSILVVAPPNSGFSDVALWVDILDERSEESGEQIFIYNVKNLEASKLATTLTNVFKVEDKKEAEEKEKRKRNEQAQKAKEGEKESPLPRNLGGGAIPVSAELKVNIVADESTNSLLIRANARDYRQLLDVITRLDLVPREVMVNVVIAEVTLSEANSFGVDWRGMFKLFRGQDAEQITAGNNFNVPTGNFPSGVEPGDSSGITNLGGLTGFTLNYLSGSINALLNFVASKNQITILSRPSLLVRNNEEASINVGSNEPFLSGVNTSTGNNQILSNDVQYKDTGITVKVTPRINDDGIINMKIYQELTQLGPPRTTQNLQSFDQRKIETHVVVRDGTAIVIGGLIQVNNQDDKQGIPGLQDFPLIGSLLFSSTSNNDKHTELVLIIIPEIVNPAADNRPMVQNYLQRIKNVSKLLNEQKVFLE